MIDKKYVVFKRLDFEEWYAELPEADYPPFIEDAVVIRRQDVFAPPALDAYGNAILCVVEAMKTDERPEIVDTVDRLQGIADYFHSQANLAWQIRDRKLPD